MTICNLQKLFKRIFAMQSMLTFMTKMVSFKTYKDYMTQIKF